jgi:hypothetical protein
MKRTLASLSLLIAFVVVLAPQVLLASQIDRFVGTYTGEADFVIEGEQQPRDLNTTIEATESGFKVGWTSVVYKSDGANRSKSYVIEFVPSQRPNVFGSAMRTNVFGKPTQLDPMNGEPFVWARLDGDTLSVFSLFISDEGDYEMQEYHRTRIDGGLELLFLRLKDGRPQKEIRAFLAQQD